MKKTKSYFGNRFKSAVRGFRAQRSAKKEIAATSAIATSEFEALEPRVLLSGVGKASTSKSWIDADGDKVVAKIVGKGAGIQVDVGDGKFIDAANINIVGGDNGALSVVVSPVGKMTTPVTTKVFWNPDTSLAFGNITTVDLGKADNLGQRIQGQWYNLTPGYTNIGSITAETSFDGTLTAPATIASINLSAVVVPVIDLGDAAVGNINLNTGRVWMVDALMSTNQASTPGDLAWTRGLGGIDLFDITAGSVDQINIAGIATGVVNTTQNDFLGTITMTKGGLNRLTGTNSTFDGNLIFQGNTASLGSVVLGGGFSPDSSITALGDLTFQADKFAGVLDVGGHLNISFKNGFTGTIIADGGVSGLRADKTDGIIVTTGDFTGQLISGANIADITFNAAKLAAGTIEATGNIGTIRFDGAAGTGSILATGDIAGLVTRNDALTLGAGALLVSAEKVGLIDVANGNLAGALVVGEIGDVLVRGGNLTADIVATTKGIGSVTVELGQITEAASLIAQNGNIGDVSVIGRDDANAAIAGDIIAENGSIGNISALNVGTGAGIGGTSTIFASENIESITATTTGGKAIDGAKIVAEGTLGPVTAVAYGGIATDAAINNLVLVAPSIGNISATSLNGIAIKGSTFTSTTGGIGSISGTGLTGGLDTVTVNSNKGIDSIKGVALSADNTTTAHGITGSAFIAQDGDIASVEGSTNSNKVQSSGINATDISASGSITGEIKGTSFAGDGISLGSVTALTGNIANITGASEKIGGDGEGIWSLDVKALKGTVGNITGTAAGNGNGLDNLDVEAFAGIGTISGSSAIGGAGIVDGTYSVTGPAGNIEAVIGSTSSGVAIDDADFNAVGGTIKAITATPTGKGGDAILDSNFKAGTLGDLNVTITNLEGGFAINNSTFRAISGDIGKITVTNNSLATNAYGIQGGAFTSDKGSIGDITVKTAGDTGSHGIFGGTDFTAAQNIGAIDVRTTGNGSDGINDVQFTADSDSSTVGNIASIFVKVDGVGSNGIVSAGGGADVKAQNITGAIEVQVTNLAGADAIVGAAVNDPWLDVKGNVGSLTINNAGLGGDANGLQNVKLTIAGTLGAVNITTVGGVGMKGAAIDPTTIASVTIKSDNGAGANEKAMQNSTIESTVSIGNVTITGDVLGGVIKTANLADTKTPTSIGDIKITGNLGPDGATQSLISAGTTIGKVEITGNATGGTIQSGQSTATGAAGTITSIKVDGDMSTAVTAALGNISSLTVGGDFSGVVSAAKGNIGASSFKTVSGAASLSAGTATVAAGTVGNITITGDLAGDQIIAVQAHQVGTPAAGGTVGTIEAKGMTNGDRLTVTVNNGVVSLGAVTVDVTGATDKGNLTLTGSSSALTTLSTITADGDANISGLDTTKLATIGNVSVGGQLTVGNMAVAKTVGTINANDITAGGAVTIGNSIAGSTLGLVTLTTGALGGAPVVTFKFLGLNGVVTPGSTAPAVNFTTPAETDILTNAVYAAGAAGVTSGNIKVVGV